MSHPARGPRSGIAGKAIAAGGQQIAPEVGCNTAEAAR